MDYNSKGTCFKCVHNWGLTHIFPDKHLQLLIREEDNPSDEPQPVSDDSLVSNNHEMACLALDYRALDPCELARSKTIKLEGTLVGYPILLLVDSGTSHNFIAREMVVIAYPKGFAKLYQSELASTLLRSVPMCWIWGDSTWSWG